MGGGRLGVIDKGARRRGSGAEFDDLSRDFWDIS
jgi:hypothetical protein